MIAPLDPNRGLGSHLKIAVSADMHLAEVGILLPTYFFYFFRRLRRCFTESESDFAAVDFEVCKKPIEKVLIADLEDNDLNILVRLLKIWCAF